MHKQWQTGSEAETEQIGEQIGVRLRGGEVIELRSDVGGGKTVLTRGLVRGAGSQDAVASPTFTITKEYRIDKPSGLSRIIHADMYRLADPGVMRHELADAVDEHSALVVEWADIVQDVLPDERVIIEITRGADDGRIIKISAPETLSYLLKGAS